MIRGFILSLILNACFVQSSFAASVTTSPSPSISNSSVFCWGDSLTEGYDGTLNTLTTSYPTDLANLIQLPALTEGFPGQDSTYILNQLQNYISNTNPNYNYSTVIWVGRNDINELYTNNITDPTAIVGRMQTLYSNIAQMVKLANTPNYIVLGVTNASALAPAQTEVKGKPMYNTILGINQYLASQYGSHFVDVRKYLVNRYDPTQPNDVLSIQDDTPPASLMSDHVHLNARGYAVVAMAVFQNHTLSPPIPGDVNNDGSVDFYDVVALKTIIKNYDFNKSGSVDSTDVALLQSAIAGNQTAQSLVCNGATYPCSLIDFNHNGVIDTTDVTQLQSIITESDMTGDKKLNDDDVQIIYKMASGIGPTNPMYAVPTGTDYLIQAEDTSTDTTLLHKFLYVSKAGSNSESADPSSVYYNMGEANKVLDYAIISGTGPFTLQITKLGSSASSALIRPARLGIGTVSATTSSLGSSVTITLNQPAKLTVEFNDDPNDLDQLALLVHATEVNIPSSTATTVFNAIAPSYLSLSSSTNNSSLNTLSPSFTTVYFPPGVHEVGRWTIPPTVNEVYLEKGAYVRGYFDAFRTNNTPINIHGRGILTNDTYAFHSGAVTSPTALLDTWFTLNLRGSMYGDASVKGNVVDGITIADSSDYNLSFQGSNSSVTDIFLHGWQFNNDGIHISGANNLISNVFFHVNDDQIAPDSNVSNLTIQNCTFWSMVGGSVLQLGWWPHSINTILFQNSDLIHQEWNLSVQAGALISGINTQIGDIPQPVPLVQNITVKNINLDVPVTRLIDLSHIRNNAQGPLTTYVVNYSNFSFSNINLNNQGTIQNPLIFLDNQTYSQLNNSNQLQNFQGLTTGFTFKGLMINGTDMGSSTLLNSMNLLKLNTYSGGSLPSVSFSP